MSHISVPNPPVLFASEAHPLQATLVSNLGAQPGAFTRRQFPDGESYLRVQTPVAGKHCIVIADLSYPNDKYLPLIFLLETLRDLGAARVGVVAPYLSYLRQDKRFHDGEAITSKIFAQALSQHMDWLVTVDPHLHRYHTLDSIYSVPSSVVSGAPALAAWLKAKTDLLLVGPDAESEQWVSDIALQSGHPFVIGAKQRFGDRDVNVSLPDITAYATHTAVIIDDVIASGQTILQCIKAIKANGMQRVCVVAVHGIFVEGVDAELRSAGLESLLSTNTITHSTNAIDVTPLLIDPITRFLSK
ncbi:MAG: ribose-phosphate diphosphokinase [Gammaproteobacteria bacterium]